MTELAQLAQRCVQALYEQDYAAQELGINIQRVRPGYVQLGMEVRQTMLNGHAICHGGLIFTLADTAFAYACNSYNRVTVAAGCTIDYLSPAQQGDQLLAIAQERYQRARHGIYDVEIQDRQGRLIALFRGKSHRRDKPLLPEES